MRGLGWGPEPGGCWRAYVPTGVVWRRTVWATQAGIAVMWAAPLNSIGWRLDKKWLQ